MNIPTSTPCSYTDLCRPVLAVHCHQEAAEKKNQSVGYFFMFMLLLVLQFRHCHRDKVITEKEFLWFWNFDVCFSILSTPSSQAHRQYKTHAQTAVCYNLQLLNNPSPSKSLKLLQIWWPSGMSLPHRFSIGFKWGLCAGHSITFTLNSWRQFSTRNDIFLDHWQTDWKAKQQPNPVLLEIF